MRSLCESPHGIEEATRLTLDHFIAAGVTIIDGYNTTLTRADHTENVGAGQAVIHFGPEVSDLHNQIFSLAALQHFGCSADTAALEAERQAWLQAHEPKDWVESYCPTGRI
eukprot:SAG25_NODE_1228_length_3560_cov_1.934142_4_plen_111_part_00